MLNSKFQTSKSLQSFSKPRQNVTMPGLKRLMSFNKHQRCNALVLLLSPSKFNKKLMSYLLKCKEFLAPKMQFLIKCFFYQHIDFISRKLKLTYGYRNNANSFIEIALTLTTIRILNNRVSASIPSHTWLTGTKKTSLHSVY